VQRALELTDEELQALDLSILEFTYRTIDLSTWQCQNDANPAETSDRWTQSTIVRTINYEAVRMKSLALSSQEEVTKNGV